MRTIIILAILLIAACTNIQERHGAEIKPKTVQKLEPNVTKNQVVAMLGSPSTTSSFGEETWYYISNNKDQNIISSDEMIDQEVLAIYFNENDKVYNVESYGLRDSQKIKLVDRKTSTAGHDLTVIEQLLGNVGRFVPSGMTGRGSDPTGRN